MIDIFELYNFPYRFNESNSAAFVVDDYVLIGVHISKELKPYMIIQDIDAFNIKGVKAYVC